MSKCECGHRKIDHIYEEGACRSGVICACNSYKEKSQGMITINKEFFTYKKPADHSPYGPSSYERWREGACPASVRLSEGIILPKQDYSDEGSLAHLVSESVFHQEFYGMSIPHNVLAEVAEWENKFPGSTAPMFVYAYEYTSIIKEWSDESRVGKILFFQLEKGLPIIPELGVYGTGDCIIIGTKASVVIDYKYGRKKVAGSSPQLQVYGVGVWRALNNLPEGYKFHTIVHQPRVSSIPESAEYNAGQMLDMYKEIWRSVELSKNISIGPNEGSHCFWCPAKRTEDPSKKCTLIKGRAFKAAESGFDRLLYQIKGEVPAIEKDYEAKRNQAVVKLLSIKDFLIDTIADLEAEYTARVLAGENIQGLKIDTKFGNRTFIESDPQKMSVILKQKLPNFEPFKEVPATTKLKTITEIEKEFKGNKNILDGLVINKGTKVLQIESEETAKAIANMMGLINQGDK